MAVKQGKQFRSSCCIRSNLNLGPSVLKIGDIDLISHVNHGSWWHLHKNAQKPKINNSVIQKVSY